MKNIVFIAVLLFCFLESQEIVAQDSLSQKRKELHLGIGPASYSGDLGGSYSSSSLLFSAGLKFNKDKKFHGNVRFSLGTVTGQELDYTTTDNSGVTATPNTFFESSFFAINYEAHYNIVDKKRVKVYISQGIGLFRFTPKDESGKGLIDQPSTRPLGESYRNLTLQLPTQIGAKYYLSNDFAFGIQFGLINPITDHLDNLGIWGNKNGNDNILTTQFQLFVPVSF
ncbi:MAG: outer membrane beta-barrel protein [Reichenbachiella sp.]|uniref:outer membrane beta-barrel protein n=1 Tax=Reichenbachiella sp. TaxID=2184521 RepID=UPI003264C3CE